MILIVNDMGTLKKKAGELKRDSNGHREASYSADDRVTSHIASHTATRCVINH